MLREFFAAPQNYPFLVALAVMMAISLLAVLAGVFGLIGDADTDVDLDLDSDVDVDVDVDIDADVEADIDAGFEAGHVIDPDGAVHGALHGHSALNGLLGIIGLGAVPITVLAVVASCTFFLGGFIAQWIAYSATGAFMNGWAPIMAATALMLLCLNLTGRLGRKLKIKLHTTALHSDSFVGHTAKVIGGTATKSLPAQAKFIDKHSQVHYLLVQPVGRAEVLHEGSDVVLLGRKGAKFYAVPANDFDLDSDDIESLTQELNH